MVNNDNLGLLLGGFISIIMGVIFLGVIADTVTSTTTLDAVGNESFTAVTDSFVDLTNTPCPIVSEIRNNTGSVMVLDTDYFVRNDVCAINVTITAGTYFADYQFEGANYVNDRTSRVLISLIILFFAIAVMVIFIGPLMKMLKENGLG